MSIGFMVLFLASLFTAPQPLEGAERAPLKVTAAAMEVSISFPDGCATSANLTHGLKLETDGCEFCVVEGVLDARGCDVMLTTARPLFMAMLNYYGDATAEFLDAQGGSLWVPLSCAEEQVSSPCTIGISTIPVRRIGGALLSGGWFDGLVVVR